MKRILVTCLISAFSLVVFAQKNPPVLEDLAKGISGANAFAFDDHLNIMQIATDNNKFDLVAINDQMQVVWKVSLDGYAIKTDKLKGKVIALASADHSKMLGTTNTYIAYVLDPANGKVLASKEVYHSSNEYVEQPQMFTGGGAFFKLAVRQTAFKRKIHVGLPIVSFISINGYTREMAQTRNLQVVEYNDKLDSLSAFKAVVSNGSFISMTWNKHADMFISWLNGPSIEVYKYDAGKTTPSNQMTVPVTFKVNSNSNPADMVTMEAGEDNNSLYYGLVYEDPAKNAVLGIGKLDLQNNKQNFVTTVMNKDVLKAYKKSFVPMNKELDDVDMGYPNGMTLKALKVGDGKVVSVVSCSVTNSSSSGRVYFVDYCPLINCYAPDLKLKFQQILPTADVGLNMQLYNSYRINNGKLYALANLKNGLVTIQGVFALLDLNSGKWDKMEVLSKKHIDNSAMVEGRAMLWYGNNYIVPYFEHKGMFSLYNFNITLQQGQY